MVIIALRRNFVLLIIFYYLGAFYTCDKNYTSQLRDILRKHLGNDIVLFTTGEYLFYFRVFFLFIY
jgi:hypothetical protein